MNQESPEVILAAVGDEVMVELSNLHLSLVGGGCGEVVVA